MMNCIAMSWFVLPTLPDWSNMKTRSTFRSQAEEEKGGREGGRVYVQETRGEDKVSKNRSHTPQCSLQLLIPLPYSLPCLLPPSLSHFSFSPPHRIPCPISPSPHPNFTPSPPVLSPPFTLVLTAWDDTQANIVWVSEVDPIKRSLHCQSKEVGNIIVVRKLNLNCPTCGREIYWCDMNFHVDIKLHMLCGVHCIPGC